MGSFAFMQPQGACSKGKQKELEMSRIHHNRRSILSRACKPFELLESRTMMSGVPATFQDVGVLTARQSVPGDVAITQAVDSYRLQMPVAGTLNLLLSGMTHNANLHLLDSAGNEIGASRVAGTANDQITTGVVAAGTYFAQVDFVNDGTAGTSTPYTLRLTPDKAGGTIDTARDLGDLAVATTATVNDFIGAGDVDFYKFSLSSTRNVDVLMNNLTANADIQVIVDTVNPGTVDTGEVVLSSTNLGTNFDEVSPTFAPGTYFLRILRVGTAETNYRLNINSLPGATPDDHGGDSASNAKAIGTLGAATQTFVDFVGGFDGADVYQFNLARLSRVNLQLDGLHGNADLQLFTAPSPSFNPETLISSSVNSNALSEDIAQTVAPGTYFLRVRQVSGDTSYRLRMNVTEEDGAGESTQNARDLGTLSNRSFNERVGGPDSDDFFKFKVDSFKHVKIDVNGLSTADVDLQLLSGNGSVITTSSHAGSANESITRDLVPGTYFARVLPKIGEGPYHINFNVTSGADNAGGSLATAKNLGSLTQGSEISLNDYVGPDDVRDTYKFTLPNGSRVSATFTPSISGVSIFFVQDKNGNGLIESSEKSFGASDLVPGTFFLRIQNENNTGTLYDGKLTVEDINDGAGNTRSTAKNMGTIDEPDINQQVSGYVGFDDTKDFYKFKVDGFSTIKITLDHLVGDADITLFDADGNELKSSKHGGTNSEEIEYTHVSVFDGTFFVKVERFSSANTTYRVAFAG